MPRRSLAAESGVGSAASGAELRWCAPSLGVRFTAARRGFAAFRRSRPKRSPSWPRHHRPMASIGSARFLLPRGRSTASATSRSTLLEAAGWSRPLLAEWATAGTVLELYDPADDEPQGAAIVDAVDGATYELRAWASTVDPAEPAVLGPARHRHRRRVAAQRWTARRGVGRRRQPATPDAPARRRVPLRRRRHGTARTASSRQTGRPIARPGLVGPGPLAGLRLTRERVGDRLRSRMLSEMAPAARRSSPYNRASAVGWRKPCAAERRGHR